MPLCRHPVLQAVSARWFALTGRVAIEPGRSTHSVLQDRLIYIRTVDRLPVGGEAIPYVLDPEDGMLRFGGELLLNGIVNRFRVDSRPQPERDVDLPLL